MSAEEISNQNIKDLTYLIQSDKIAVNAKPREQLPPKKSISKVDEEMVREYNKQFEKIKERKEPLINGMTGDPELDENGEVIMITKKYKYNIPVEQPDYNIPELLPVMRGNQLLNREKRERQLHKYFIAFNENLKADNLELRELFNAYDNQKLTREEYMRERQNVLNSIEFNKNSIRAYEEQMIELENERLEHNKNILHNESLIDATRIANLNKRKNYFEQVKLLNSGAFNTEKLINETDDEYYDRLRRNVQEESVDDLVIKASEENNKKFKELLKKLIRDDVKIESVTNILSDEVKLNIIKKEPLFKEKFLKLYGENNRNLSIENILEFCVAFNKSMSGEDAILNYLSNIPKSIVKEKEVIVLNNMIIFSNVGRSVYFKVLDTLQLVDILSQETIKQIVYSFTGDKGSFEPYFTKQAEYIKEEEKEKEEEKKRKKKGEPAIEPILEPIGETVVSDYLDISKQKIRSYLGGQRENTILNKLLNDYGLTPEFGSLNYKGQVKFKDNTKREMFGWGINNEEITDEVSFVNLKLKLNKLFYKNFLSLVDKNGINIPSFKQVKVSDNFVRLIMNITKDKFPSKMELENLNQTERNLFDRVIHLAKLHKNPHLEKNINKSIEETLKKELNLIEEDINAGNNNKELVREMEKILMSLVDYGCITYKNAKKHINQYL